MFALGLALGRKSSSLLQTQGHCISFHVEASSWERTTAPETSIDAKITLGASFNKVNEA